MASEQNAKGICDRCGWEYPLPKLFYESQPNQDDTWRVCKSCLDPYNERDDADAYEVDEDTSLEDPRPEINIESQRTKWAWSPVGNGDTIVTSVNFRWADD